jgi:hypothetical protein
MWPKMLQLWHQICLWWMSSQWSKFISHIEQHERLEKWGNSQNLYHDNAVCHSYLTVQHFLVKNQILTISYPLYLPGISLQILACSEPQNWAVRPLFHFHIINSTECNRKCHSKAKRGIPELFEQWQDCWAKWGIKSWLTRFGFVCEIMRKFCELCGPTLDNTFTFVISTWWSIDVLGKKIILPFILHFFKNILHYCGKNGCCYIVM